MKWNWGSGLVLGMVLFMSMIVFFVIRMIQSKVDLVRDDYYETAIQYDTRQQRLSRGIPFADSIKISASYEQQQVLVQLPISLLKADSAKLVFYRPSDRTLDFSRIPKNALDTVVFRNKPSGVWKLIFEGYDGRLRHLVEKEFVY